MSRILKRNCQRKLDIPAHSHYNGIKEGGELMTSKKFDLLIAMIIEMLKNNQTERVIELLEEAREKKDNQKSDNNS